MKDAGEDDLRAEGIPRSYYLVRMEVRIPVDLPPDERARLLGAEADRARQLAADGTLVQLWRVTGRRANVGIWSAATCDALHEALESLPLYPFLEIEVLPVSTHPNAPRGG